MTDTEQWTMLIDIASEWGSTGVVLIVFYLFTRENKALIRELFELVWALAFDDDDKRAYEIKSTYDKRNGD